MNPLRAINIVMTPMISFGIKAGLRRLALIFLLALPLAATAAEQRTFATPEAAVDAVLAALKANDEAALLTIFGDKHKELMVTGDPAYDSAKRAEAAANLAAYRVLEDRGADRRILLMGVNTWPMPIPLVRAGGVWRFATEEGIEELINRRIGHNENSAIEVLQAYLGAQRQYAAVDRDGDGVRQFAQKLFSAPGKHDGLYWPADAAKGEEESPFGPLIGANEVYLKGHKQGDAYRGYHFRILTRQGKSAAGDAYNYVINGRMIAGFAMVAYPAEYGETGVMSFIVNHNGNIFQKDLGKNSTKIGGAMTSFDPGTGWKEVTH